MIRMGFESFLNIPTDQDKLCLTELVTSTETGIVCP